MNGRTLGRYRVVDRIGQGGMAEVWRAVDDDGRTCALKVLTLRRPELRDRFRAEARAQLALRHPHIVRARELLEVDGEPALAMEYVPGATLDRWLGEAAPPLSARDAVAFQVLDAVAHAHDQRLVHRDLKPGNVLVVDLPTGPIAKLTDFGLVKDLDHSATRSGVALGTPRYMAPEQIRDAKRVDARADVWSLGALLYELYTDRSPFHRDTLLDTFTAVTEGAFPDPATFGVPERVRTAIGACLQVDPDRRVQTVRDLARLLAGEAAPIGAPPRDRPRTAEPALPRVFTGATPRGPAPRAGPAPTPTLVAPSEPPVEEVPGAAPPPPPPPVSRRTRTPAPARARAPNGWVRPWVAGWGLALVLVLGVLVGGAALASAMAVRGALRGNDGGPAVHGPDAPRPPRRGRR